jgi:hypothetical protein
MYTTKGKLFGVFSTLVISDGTGLTLLSIFLIGPSIGRAHANLGWSLQLHDAI